TRLSPSERALHIRGGRSSAERSMASERRRQSARPMGVLLRPTRAIAPILAAAAVASLVAIARPAAQASVRVRVQTELGDVVREIDRARAPNTAANFLRYLDARHYDGGMFHRTVKLDNQPDSPVKIEVQAGVNPDRATDGFPPIPLERTSATGLR